MSKFITNFFKLLTPLCCIIFFNLTTEIFATEAGTILTGKVVTTVTRAVPVPFNAVVDEILVRPGDAVSVGSTLVRYHLQEEAERILQQEVTNGSGTENLKGQILDLERQLAQTQAQRNKARQLVSSGLGSRQALTRLEDDVQSIKRRIELLSVNIKKAESNFNSRLKELSGYFGVPVKSGAQLPSTLSLTSPIAGYILSLDSRLNPGMLLPAGSTLVQVGQMNPMLIQVPVYEAEIGRIHQGDLATVEIPSLGNKQFEASVSEIAWVSNDMNVANPSYYTVELTVPNPALELKPGFKAVVRLPAEHK